MPAGSRRALAAIAMAAAAACLAAYAWGQTASPTAAAREETPFVALDAGAHTGPIRRIAVDATETILLTASDDKTARVWDLATGAHVATLRTPVGPDAIGRLYGVAISRDGRIALGGTTAAPNGKHRIYLFDLRSHAFVKAFDARGGDVKRLEWSPDGRWLVAVYAGSPALRVFDADGRVAYEERLGGDAYYAAFWAADRFAVSASDGTVRLFAIADGKVTPSATIRTPIPDPRGLAFSPDGTLVAVGYLSRQGDSVRVDVFDVASRDLARSFTFRDVGEGNLMNVAWQRDGRALYAGGTRYTGRNRFAVKRIAWPDGTATDVDAATNSILDFVALRDGRIVFATAEPAWGVVREGRVEAAAGSPTAQFYDASMLRINADATEVSWSYRVGEPPVHFSLAGRQVRDGAGEARRGAEPSTFRLRVTDWENHFHPKLNGAPLRLEPTEVARAAAVLPDHAGVVLGSSRSLRRFDANGTQAWIVSLPTEARALAVTADGKIVVVAMLDGTIAWRRTADGVPLLTLFATRDRRWVAWTELGHFDASAGGEVLVGWLVNRASGEQADYFALSRFRERFYRPDVVDRILRAHGASEALAAANADRKALASTAAPAVRQRVETITAPVPVEAALPPAVTLLSPAKVTSADTTLTVEYKVLSRVDAPVTGYAVRVDGRPYEAYVNRPPASADGVAVGSMTLELPQRESDVQIFAASVRGVSEPAAFTFRWRAPPKAAAQAPSDPRPVLRLLAIGVARYANSKYDLPLAAKDATDFTGTLLRQNGAFYRQVDARIVTNDRATRAGVLEALGWLKRATAAGDVGILYLAGHGINDVDDTYYFLPHDFALDRLPETGVGEEVLRDALTSMAGRSIFFVDTCYSGKSIGVLSNRDLTRIANRLSSAESGVIVFSGSTGRQESLESADWGNGAFTKALVEGLRGGADYRKEGVVTHKGLDYFVSNEVKKLTRGMQTPVTTVPMGLGDFGLARVLPEAP